MVLCGTQAVREEGGREDGLADGTMRGVPSSFPPSFRPSLPPSLPPSLQINIATLEHLQLSYLCVTTSLLNELRGGDMDGWNRDDIKTM